MYIDDIERFFLVHIINFIKNKNYGNESIVYARIFRAGMCWDGGEKGGAWHLKALLMLRYERPIRMSGAVKGNLNLQTILQTIFN